ncbi:hypothetical protein M0805_005936 [Coniferiporia weirii]|nr:hypothetical protein M0805_005936 [Coniferiporia weirii]
MSISADAFTLPQDYTFSPDGVLMHTSAYEWLEKLLEKANNRNPDMHGVYVYNDFRGYAILDLIDGSLSSIHSLVTRKKWLDAWHALDALTEFMDSCSDWATVDDGPRVIATDKAYGALLIVTVRALASTSPPLLDEATLPGLEETLRRMANWGDNMGFVECSYSKVLKGFGCKLFGSRTPEEREQTKAARVRGYEVFVRALSQAERKRRGDSLPGEDDSDDDDDDEDDDDSVWYGGAAAKDAEYSHANLKITPVWKEYKSKLMGAQRVPQRGPPTWDLTKWSAADKKKVSLDG